VFLFQLAKGGLDREIYKKLIAPFKNDLPATEDEAIRKICNEHKYAFFGKNILKKNISSSTPCEVLKLPGYSYKDPVAFTTSKNCRYKSLINWR
jgi:hypothetical protein